MERSSGILEQVARFVLSDMVLRAETKEKKEKFLEMTYRVRVE